MLSKYLTARWLLRFTLPLLVLAVILYIFFIRDSSTTKTIIPSTSPQPAKVDTPSASNNAASDTSNPASKGSSQKESASAPASGGQLTLAEAQTFVSNHAPGQNGSGTSEQSTCNTTPGATCYIQFTNGSAVKQLEPKVAGNDGSVLWNWDINSAGLTSGSWTIEAIAQLNGQTKTVQDQRQLIVQ